MAIKMGNISHDAIILTRCTHMYEMLHIETSCNLINYKFIALTPFSTVKKERMIIEVGGKKEEGRKRN
jgi:hypothetical protein